jgi:hypothetical protein
MKISLNKLTLLVTLLFSRRHTEGKLQGKIEIQERNEKFGVLIQCDTGVARHLKEH